MNIFTGGLSLFINFVNLVQGNYYAAGTGLLFCFTYLFVAINNIFKLSSIPFAWFSTFVAINAVVFGTLEGFIGSTALGIHLVSLGNPLGNIFCRRHHGEKAWKICSGTSGVRGYCYCLDSRCTDADRKMVKL